MTTRTVLVDDIDGTEAAETVLFGLDGSSYEIDLSNKNAKELRETLQRFVDVARRRPGGGKRKATATPRQAPTTATVDREQLRAIREWWNKKPNVKKVSNRGRIPQDVVDKFREEHSTEPAFSHA